MVESKFKRAQKFELVHRSVQDKLQYDPNASVSLFKPVGRSGQTIEELERILSQHELERRDNEGEAAEHGIFFDDTQYDYMQHMRSVEEDGETQLIPKKVVERPTLASLLEGGEEIPLLQAQEAVLNVPSELQGLNPDMDPALRQVLEALDDEAFVQDAAVEDGEDFFAELVHEGELIDGEEVPDWEQEEQDERNNELRSESNTLRDDESLSLSERMMRFKLQSMEMSRQDDTGSVYSHSEGGDTLGSMMSLGGGRTMRKLRKLGSASSAYSMSSSSMFRNEQLTALDERLEVLEEDYDRESSDEESETEDIMDREGIEEIMDEFLEKYEVVAGRYRPTVEGATPFEKADNLRKSTGAALISKKVWDQAEGILPESDYESEPEEPEKADRWDCETILTTFTNIENHPKIISARKSAIKCATEHVPKIQVSAKTGMPIRSIIEAESESESDQGPARETVTRPRNETAEAKKARKEQSKAEKQARKDQKRETKQLYALEKKRQTGVSNKKVASADIATRGGGKQITIL